MSKERTPEEWAEYCQEHIRHGYVPSGKRNRRNLYQYGQELANRLRSLGLWRPGDLIVDIGCGNGRLAMGLLKEPIFYRGLDVVAGAIAFCKAAFQDYPHLDFMHLDVRNSRYNPRGTLEPGQVKLPYRDGSAACVICSSLFTHLGSINVARHYLAEIARIMRGDGKLYSTWLTAPPHLPSSSARRTVFLYESILNLLHADFVILKVYGGETTRRRDQRVIVAQRRLPCWT